MQLASFQATTFDQLFDGVASVAQGDWIDAQGKVTVVTKAVDSLLFAHHSIQAVGKKAVVSVLQRKYGSVEESGAEYKVELDITKTPYPSIWTPPAWVCTREGIALWRIPPLEGNNSRRPD